MWSRGDDADFQPKLNGTYRSERNVVCPSTGLLQAYFKDFGFHSRSDIIHYLNPSRKLFLLMQLY